MMSIPEKEEVLQRFDRVERLLTAAAAFSLLLATLHEDDDAQQLAEESRTALADLEEGRRGLKIFLGRKAIGQIREAEIGCSVLLGRLAERDRTLSPASLRRYLRQALPREPHELTSLFEFYLHLEREPQWSSQRVDKVDLLITELSRRSNGEPAGSRLSQLLAASGAATGAAITELERRTFKRTLQAIESEVEAADSLSQLIESGTLKRYRALKHRLGRLLLHPDVLTMIIETNRSLQRKIRRLNSRTVTGIFSVYQGIFERGQRGRFDRELTQEIDQLNLEFDHFEQQVKRDEIRLTELERFWSNLTSFSARLDEAASASPDAGQPASTASAQAQELPGALPGEGPADWLEEDLLALLDLLRENDRKGWPAEYVSFSPREEFQLEAREIQAYRRLGEDEIVDRALELFLLKAAALRRNIKRSARKLAGVSDREISRELPVFATAKQAVQLAESFLARYAQAVEQSILEGDVSEAQQLQILRMRLVRESAGVWLQVYKRE